MFEINNTYNPYSTSTAYNSSYTSGSYQAHSAFHQQEGSYRIGQNRIISSVFEQPKLAEVVNLNTMEIGAENVYSEQSGGPNAHIRRVGGNDHQSDPFLKTPIGDALLPLLLLAIGYVVWRRVRRIVKEGRKVIG